MSDLALGDAHLVPIDDRVARDAGSDMVRNYNFCMLKHDKAIAMHQGRISGCDTLHF